MTSKVLISSFVSSVHPCTDAAPLGYARARRLARQAAGYGDAPPAAAPPASGYGGAAPPASVPDNSYAQQSSQSAPAAPVASPAVGANVAPAPAVSVAG